MSIQVIHVHGRARKAYVEGETIYREESIFVPSERAWFPTVDTNDHFVYRQEKRRGSSLMCTCGSIAGIYLPDVYMRFQSVYRGRMICCNALMQNRKHADGTIG